jgi:16S rRNA (uracil1498-N3)-methyltransferase
MPSNRFYCDDDLKRGTASLEGEEFHHLARVMRLQENDGIELVNGRGTLARATIQKVEKNQAMLHITAVETAEKPDETILAQALPRMNHLEWIIEKGTELGATAFWLFPGEYSEKKALSDNQQQRLRSLLTAAMKQCGSLFLPSFLFKPSLEEWHPLSGSLFYGDTRKSAPKLPSPVKAPVTFFIGPEKGFSEKEIGILERKLKVQGIKLHDNILRAETAGIAALAQIFYAR